MSLTETVDVASQPALRRRAIDPLLERIRAAVEANPGGESTCRIPIGNRIIELTHWEWSVLSRGLRQGVRSEDEDPQADRWPARLGEGVAFQARYLSHVSRIQEGPPPAPGELETFRRDLVTDAALGLAFQEELQRDVDNLVALGELDEAKKLTAFRHKIGQSLGRLKEFIGGAAFVEAEATAAEIAAPAPKQRRLRVEGLEEGPAPDISWAKRDTAHGPVRHLEVRTPNRTRPLLLALVTSVVLFAVLQLAPGRATGPPVLPQETFLAIDGIARVLVRPPSLFVTVESDRWGEMSAGEREELVGAVGRIAQQAGYTGAHFLTDTGTTVAQWMRNGGAHLLADSTPQPGVGS